MLQVRDEGEDALRSALTTSPEEPGSTGAGAAGSGSVSGLGPGSRGQQRSRGELAAGPLAHPSPQINTGPGQVQDSPGPLESPKDGGQGPDALLQPKSCRKTQGL